MMGFDDPRANGEPQAGAFFRVGAGIVGAVKAVEDPILIFGRNPNALIRNDELRLIEMGRQRYLNGPARPRIFDGIVHEVQKELTQPQFVAQDDRRHYEAENDLYVAFLDRKSV